MIKIPNENKANCQTSLEPSELGIISGRVFV